MSKEYIERNSTLQNLPDDLPYKASVKRVLMQAPAADVVEVVHGKNISCKMDAELSIIEFICSECGFKCVNQFEGVYNKRFDITYFYPCEFDYCPHCGAKMDGERKEV